MIEEKFIIPDSFYVGFNKREYGKLAFLTVDGTDKAAQKRKETVDKWADNKIPKIVVKNELLEGYSIEQCVRRTYWGGGNIVWTIVDPRGFCFEIQSSNLARIIDTNSIIDGKIVGKCILGRMSGGNYLLTENSEPYLNSVRFTQVATSKSDYTIKDLKPGYVFMDKSEIEYEYLGQYYALVVEQKYHSGYGNGNPYPHMSNTGTVSVVKKPVRLVRHIAHGDYYSLMSDFKIHSIISTEEKVVDWNEISNKNESFCYGGKYVAALFNEKVEFKELRTIPITQKPELANNLLFNLDGKLYSVQLADQWQKEKYRGGWIYTLTLKDNVSLRIPERITHEIANSLHKVEKSSYGYQATYMENAGGLRDRLIERGMPLLCLDIVLTENKTPVWRCTRDDQMKNNYPVYRG